MKIDLHVHSKHSVRPSQWVLRKIGCPESYTEPERLREIALARGMSFVTITDHNTIAGCLEIAHLPGTFISEEVTAYFPEDGCKVHVLVHNITEAQHMVIRKARENIHDLVFYLRAENISHACAHPLYAVNDRLSVDHFEKLLLLFRTFELNGSRAVEQNAGLQLILESLGPRDMKRLAERHRIEPGFPEPWKKSLMAGSDDHSSLGIARSYTETDEEGTVEEFLRAVSGGRARPRVRTATPKTLAHHLYSIAWQFYSHRFNLDRHVNRDGFLHLLDRFLRSGHEEEPGLFSRLALHLQARRKPSRAPTSSLQDALRCETRRLLREDPELLAVSRSGDAGDGAMADTWFRFVSRASGEVFLNFAQPVMEHLLRGNVFSVFQALGSAGALGTVVAPYFVAYSIFSRERVLSRNILSRFARGHADIRDDWTEPRVAHFTDTLHEVNGVALTLRQQAAEARKAGKRLTVITCDAEGREEGEGFRTFAPIGFQRLPEYPDQTIFYPPFLDILDYCYREDFTHIHSATPGPVGLAALAAARILGLPIVGTYHTEIPQYARHLTGDTGMEDLAWKYTLWYYDQMATVYVPSKATGDELIARGLAPEKVRLFPRGVDTERFHPEKARGLDAARYGLRPGPKLLYVGRVSKEKGLDILAEAYERLLPGHPGLQLVIVGDGPHFSHLRKRLARTPAVFTGWLDGEALASVYAACDIFLFPSVTDTFGNVVLEAQASGLPVVVTDEGGPRENMVHGETGLVVSGGDAGALAGAAGRLLSDPEGLARMKKAARRYVEGRSFEAAFHETWRMYCEPAPALARAV